MGSLSFLAVSAPLALLAVGFPRCEPAQGSAERAAQGDVATSLAALGAPDGEERARAERWLAAYLGEADFAEVAAALQNGTAATRDALVRVLSSEDGLFGLAALLASDVSPDVARHGFAALNGQAARWSPALLAPPLADGDLPPDLGRGSRDREIDYAPRSVTLALDRGTFADLVERIDRLALAPLPIVLDPELYPGVRRGLAEPVRPARRVTLPWTEVLTTELARQRMTLRVHGFGPYDARRLEDSARAAEAAGDVRAEAAMEVLRAAAATPNHACFLWIGLRGRGAEAPGAERLAAWIVTVAAIGGDPSRREAAARALAAVRWPAATRWLALRWLATGDPAALEGTLAGLARGMAEPRLATAAVVRALLAEVDRRLALDAPGSQRFAERVGRALAGLSPVDTGGQPLVDAVLAGFDGADATGRWARLVVLEGQRRRSPAAAARARALLADAATPAPLAVQALATLRVVDSAVGSVTADGGAADGGAATDAPPFVARPGALLAAAAEAGLGAEASEWLARVRARCPWTPGEVMAALEGGPTLAVLQLAATSGRPPVPGGAGAVASASAEDATPWLEAIGAQLADPVQRVELVDVARRAAELELFPGGDPLPFVELMRRAAGGGGLAFELWRLDAGLADAATRRAALLKAETQSRALATDPRGAAEALALAAGLVADRELGAAARELIVTLITAAVEGRGGRSDGGDPGTAEPALGELTLREAVDALARAAEALGAARQGLEAEALFGTLRGLAGRGWQSLASELYGEEWPPAPPPRGRDLDALERRYGR